MTKRERLELLFTRLTDAPAASSSGTAMELIVSTLGAIEDDFAGDDDRMFPPSGDFWHLVEGRKDLDLFRQAAHDTILRDNGAILIRVRRTGRVEFEKAGQDGRKVDL